MPDIISREAEQKILRTIFESNQPELLAVYGRRRVGKTFLIREYFSHKKNSLFFYVTGMKEGSLIEQITNFTEEIGETFLYPGARLEIKNNWRNTFKILTDNIKAANFKRIVLFFDEFPWMVTKNSRLLSTLEYYWNHHWSRDPRIKLIICGSSSGWILKNIINNKGGLYNRVTRSMHLEPFNLQQTKKYFNHNKVKLSHQQISLLYMILGGIPYYLSKVEPNLSAAQIIEKLAFNKDSFLLTEFNNLYATLFDEGRAHIELAKAIASKHYGIGQEELIGKIKDLSSGGRVLAWLEELEQAGFIIRFKPFLHHRQGIYYKMIDEYSLFYFHWIEAIHESLLNRGMRSGYWERIQQSPAWHSWAGYAFEAICYKHITQISSALNVSPTAIPYTWRYIPKKSSKEQGAQIDLLFDRDDDSITICEIKYTTQPFTIDKQYAEKLQRKMDVFREITRTTKQLFLVIISANGIKKSIYSEAMVNQVITLEGLFSPPEK